jgi:hypothetical protein
MSCYQTFHKEVAKMYGATEAELNGLAVIVAQISFLECHSTHIQNYDMSKLLHELQDIEAYMSKKK